MTGFIMNKHIAACLLYLASTAALAQATEPPARAEPIEQRLQSRFDAANTSHDGKLTKAQAEAGMPMVAHHFDEIDTQNAGYVTVQQIEAFLAQRTAGH